MHKRLQVETLRYLVRNTTFDVKVLRSEFRALDLDNTGVLRVAELRAAFKKSNMPQVDVD